MNLLQALHFENPLCTAFVGAGGKTTAMFSLARQLGGSVWVTTSAHLGTDQTGLADRHYVIEEEDDILPKEWHRPEVVLLSGAETADDRLKSPNTRLLKRIHEEADQLGIPLLVEADGSRSIPLKAPGDHEPPIPGWVRQVVVVAGLGVLAKPLSEKTVYRADRFGDITGLKEGDPVSIESVRDLMLHPAGGLKNIPAHAMKVVLFNQCDDENLRNAAGVVACDLLDGGYDRVVLGGLRSTPNEFVRYARS